MLKKVAKHEIAGKGSGSHAKSTSSRSRKKWWTGCLSHFANVAAVSTTSIKSTSATSTTYDSQSDAMMSESKAMLLLVELLLMTQQVPLFLY